MSHEQLADWLAELQDARDLLRVGVEIDPRMEMTAIGRRAAEMPDGGPAVLFERIRGGNGVAVVTNLYGSYARMCRYLGGDSFDAVADRMSDLIQPRFPESWFDQIRRLPQFAQLGKLPPRVVRIGACQQVVRLGRDINLAEWPIPRFWPEDEAPTITAGMVCLRHPRSGDRVVEQVTLDVRDAQSLRVHFPPESAGAAIVREHGLLGTPLPVAVVLGGHPLLTYAAGAPSPPGCDAWTFAGFLTGQPVDLVTARTSELEIPAHAEIVFEGIIDPAEPLESCARVGLSTGTYGQPFPVPVMRLSAITSRTNPVFPVIIPDRPPRERYWLHKLTERLFLPVLRMAVPELVDYSFPHATSERRLVFVSIRKSYPGQAKKVLSGLWGHQLSMYAKIAVVVDDDVDVQDPEAVWLAVASHAQPPRDVLMQEGPSDWYDQSAFARGFGGKLGIDGTRKFPEERPGSPPTNVLELPVEVETAAEEIMASWRRS